MFIPPSQLRFKYISKKFQTLSQICPQVWRSSTMNEVNNERSEAWNIYTSSEPSPSHSEVNGTSMDAISFGFVATAILISMFLIMAIFEHLFKPSESYSSSQEGTNSRPSHSRQMQKLRDPEIVPTSYASDFSVVMPGEQYPTFIAQPAPLPCPREEAYWPSHEHSFAFP